MDLAFSQQRYAADAISLSNVALNQAALSWQVPFQALFFSAKRFSLSNATLSTDCATLYQYQDTLPAAVNQSGPGYLWVESYSSPDGAVLVSRVNVTCSAPVAVPSSGELVVPVTNAMQFLNGLAYISRYSSAQGCTTLELTQNVSLASAHWPGMVVMEPSFTIRPVNGTWTILDLGGHINKVFLKGNVRLKDLHLMNPSVARGVNVAPGSNWATFSYKIWFFAFDYAPGVPFQGRFNPERAALAFENCVVWVPTRELDYLYQWSVFRVSGVTGLGEVLQQAKRLIPVAGISENSNSTHLKLTRFLGIGYNATMLTFATTTFLDTLLPPFPVTVKRVFCPTFSFGLFTNVTQIPIYDQADMMSALEGLSVNPTPYGTALLLWNNITMDPTKWPTNGYTLNTSQSVYFADSLMDLTPVTWLDFQRVPVFVNLNPSACAGKGGPLLWFHQLTLLDMPNVVATVNGTAQYGAAAKRLNVQALDASKSWGTDQVLPFSQLVTDRRYLNIMFNLSTIVLPYQEFSGLRRYAAASLDTEFEPFENTGWYCSGERLVLNRTRSASTDANMTFNVLYIHGMLAVNTTVTYLPPRGATLLYTNVYDPPMPVKSLAGAAVDGGGSSALKAWQTALIVVGSVLGGILVATVAAWAFISRRRSRQHATKALAYKDPAAGDADARLVGGRNSDQASTGTGQQHSSGSDGPNGKMQGSEGNPVIVDATGQGARGSAASGGSGNMASSSAGPNSAQTPIDELHGMMQNLAQEINDRQLVILDVLGQGGFGTVYKGQWKGLLVAVKTITFQDRMYGGDKQQHRAVLEAAISSSLSHPNVVITYSYDIKPLRVQFDDAGGDGKGLTITAANRRVTDWKLYIIQEYCDAGSLRNAILKRKFMDDRRHAPRLEMVLDTALELAGGMHHLHDRSVVHGDLNPNNVLLKRDGGKKYGAVCKIADFGLSVKMRADQSHISNMRRGTPFYTAPEVMSKGNLTKAADVFSFGVMLWELYHSMMCYTVERGAFVVRDIFPRFPRSHCPARLAVLVAGCLADTPQERSTMAHVEAELVAMLSALRRGDLRPAAEDPGSATAAPAATAAVDGAAPSPSPAALNGPSVQPGTVAIEVDDDASTHFAIPVYDNANDEA